MRLSTSTNLFGNRRENGEYISTIESMRRCKAAGFDVLDMTFCQMTERKMEFIGDDWLEQLYNVREEAERLGITFSQSHPPFYRGVFIGPLDDKPGYYEKFCEWMRRSIIGSGILGVKWAVIHPYTDTKTAEYSNKANLKLNLDFYRPYVELAKEHGVGIAVENMYEYAQPQVKRLFGATAEEILLLADAFDDPAVGICWDFGHGNLMYTDQTIPLRKIGKRLKAVHVADNAGNFDAHLAPFVEGTIEWEKLIPLLVEIGYEGDFTYEALLMTHFAPDSLKDRIAKFTYDIGMYCLSLAK